MRELNVNEVEEVNGGNPRLLYSVFKYSYKAATALGADKLGRKIGSAVYDLTHGKPGAN